MSSRSTPTHSPVAALAFVASVAVGVGVAVITPSLEAGEANQIIDLWPESKIPGPAPFVSGEERDLTKPEDRLIAGRRIIKLGHVSNPQMHVYLPEKDKANGAAVVICPGGGYHILAWDLEGIEVAEWLNEIGVAGIVLKYRVPAAKHGNDLKSIPGDSSLELPAKALGPVMDAQRALSLARANAEAWNLNPQKIGILGFSAGGNTAALTALALGRRAYSPIDDADRAPCGADFAMLIYPGYLAKKDGSIQPFLEISEASPPMFFVHAADDRVSPLNSTVLFNALVTAGVPAEAHVFAKGGHGYGLRPAEDPVTRWSQLGTDWLRSTILP